jgi:hypothetical protein
MADKGGGPAFPRAANGGVGYWSDEEGITVRDYFANGALVSIAEGMKNNTPAQVATRCYALADAMLVERAKP